jgi:hypothetical protein
MEMKRLRMWKGSPEINSRDGLTWLLTFCAASTKSVIILYLESRMDMQFLALESWLQARSIKYLWIYRDVTTKELWSIHYAGPNWPEVDVRSELPGSLLRMGDSWFPSLSEQSSERNPPGSSREIQRKNRRTRGTEPPSLESSTSSRIEGSSWL